MSTGFAYDYELRDGAQIIATGRLYSDQPLDEGDPVEVIGRDARVREILPGAQQLDGRLVLVLPNEVA